MSHHPIEDHDLGLSHDLPRIARTGVGRRGLLGIAGGLGLTALTGCGAGDAGTGAAVPAVEATSGEIPEETGGPFPGDGSNGPNVLTESGVVRSDLTTSFGEATGVAAGVPLTIRMRVYDLNGDQAGPLPGAAVYLWHCDRDGNYSMYSAEAADENYLRGVQEADADGALEFTTIFPACYSGRWPHAHFEVYASLADATSASGRLRTSQLAFPEETCAAVYAAAPGYEASVPNLAQVSLDTDMVFADGYSLQLARMSGSVEQGLVATLNVPV